MRSKEMFSSWPLVALVAGVKMGSGNLSDSSSPAGNKHGASGELVSVLVKGSGEGCRAENVIGDHVAEEVEPKERKLGQDAAFIGDRRGHHHVESRKAIRGNDE